MPKKPGEPHNEKRYSLKPLTTKEALEKALKAKPKKGKAQGSSSRKPQAS